MMDSKWNFHFASLRYVYFILTRFLNGIMNYFRSHSMGTDKIIAATATVSLFPNGQIEADARVATPNKKEVKEMAKKRRESREQEQYRQANVQVLHPTTPGYTPGYTPGVQRTYSNATPAGGIVQRTYSNAGSMPNRPHSWQEKKAYGAREKCAPCEKKIRIAKTYHR